MTAIRSLAFGELLKHYRIAARLTQEELATRSGLSVRGISALERGVNRAPRKDTLALLLRALDLSTRERSTLELAARQHNHLHAVSPHASVAPPFALGDPTPSPRPLVGRTRELLALERHLAGQFPPVLLLAGEPGIGKTRLMQETGVSALTQGLQVLRGGCHKRDGQDSYEPLLGALEAYVRSQPPAQLHANLEGCARLVRLMPELVEMGYLSAPEWTLAPEQERRLMFRSVQQFLSNIAEPAGILLLLDDLQWAGTDALDLLAALAESGNAARLRVVAAYRTTDVHSHDPLSTTLAELVRNGLATQIELGPLTPHESEELLWELLRDHEARTNELVARILRRAGGVPFFLVSCASGLQRSTSSADTAVDLPWTVAQSIRQRVAALPVLAQALLNAAAVAGRQAPQTMLVAIGAQLGHDKLAVLGALDVACRARLLMEDGTNSYQFPHDLVREALEADLTAPHRTALHQQVAEALKQGEGEQPAALLAYHFGCAGDDRQAAFYLQQAGDHALAIQAHAAAETYFRELINRLERLGRSAQVAQAREQLGVVLTNLARYDQALDLLDRAAEAYRVANDLEGWARTTAEIGSVHALRGTAVEGVARLRPLLEVLTTSEVSVRNLANLYVTHAWLVNENARYDEALAGAERAAKLARDARDSALLTQAELRRGQALLMLGHLQDGMQVLQQAIPLAEISGDLRSLRFALNSLSWIYELWGEFELDRQYTERAFAVAERLGDPSVIAFMLCNRGGPAFNLGQWDQARTDYERALAMTRQMDTSWASIWPPLLLGQLCLVQGQCEPATSFLEEAIGLAEHNGALQALRWAQGALAERDLLEHRPQVAYARLQPLLDRSGQEESDATKLLPLLAWAHLELGEERQAGAVLGQCITRATAQNMRLVLADALRIEALLATRQAHWDVAECTIAEALALSRAMPSPYAEAKVYYVYGHMLAWKGEPELARERLRTALAILSRLGERLYAERVEQGLAQLS